MARFVATVLVASGALASLLAPARAQAPAAPCAIVFAQPRADTAASEPWTAVNREFIQYLAQGLAQAGWRVLRMNVPPDTDPASLVPALLGHADVQRCPRLLEGSLFIDEAGELIVIRLRVYPVVQQGTRSFIGEPLSTLRQEFPNSQVHLDRLVPARLAQRFAHELAAAPP